MLVWVNEHIMSVTLILGLGSIVSSIGGAWVAVYTRYKKFGYTVMFCSMIINLMVICWTGYLVIKFILIDGIPCIKHIWTYGLKWHTIVPVVLDIASLMILCVVIHVSMIKKRQ